MNSTTLHVTTQAIGDETLVGDVSTGVFRLLVPIQHREAVFQSLHAIHHPGVRATRRLIAARFCWPQMAKAITQRARACLHCQRGKVHRHVHLQPAEIPVPHRRFAHIHVHLVGPLPPSHQGTLRRLGITIWSSSHHHIRQSGPIHVRPLGGPVQPAQHPALAHDSIPSSVKRIGRAVPQAAEGRLAVPGRHHRLARPRPLGAAGYQGRLQRGQRIFTGGGGVPLAADSTWTVHQHRRVALPVIPQRSADHDDRPPTTAARHNAAPAPSTLPEELLLARFVLVRRDGAQPPLSPIYDVPYRVLERSTHFFLLEMGDRTDKVSTLSA
jgi:hypothetical protein